MNLRETETTKAVRHEDVSILFADIVGFTNLAASMPAEDVVQLLATVFERFDTLIEECGVEKIKPLVMPIWSPVGCLRIDRTMQIDCSLCNGHVEYRSEF